MSLVNPPMPAGVYYPYAGFVLPPGYLWCDGSAISRTTYSALYANLVPVIGTFTVTVASPGVVTLNGHGLQTGDAVFLTTTGALPTGLAINTLYYAIRVDANTVRLAASRANAYVPTPINTSGTQSGTHTMQSCGWGLGDGTTTFNVPDMRGRTVAGNDSIGGTVASRLTLARSQGVYGNQGSVGGAETHQLITAELASHTHTGTSIGANSTAGGNANYWAGNNAGSHAPVVGNAGSDTAHNNVQPTAVSNWVIKY